MFRYHNTNTRAAPYQKTLTLPEAASFQQCSTNNFPTTDLPFLNLASPLPISEFVERRSNLAVALVKDDIDAFIVEPGYTFQYYANISQRDWEVWEPEERPFLKLVRPFETRDCVVAKTTFLAPSFEVERVKQTKIEREIRIVRAVNTGMVEALRATRQCMYSGLTENEVMEVLDNSLRAAGMELFFDIVLFGRF